MLSIVIIAKNEEATIRQCLQSVQFADEIIVLDSGSTDNTVAIAQEFTSKVFSTQDWPGYGVQKQRALAHATGDWVLNLDADEALSDALQAEIQQAIAKDTADAYRIPIRMIFYNQVLKYSGSPNRHIRLFKRAGARYSDDIVHEKIVLPPQARVQKLTNTILHNSFRDVRHALYKMNKYSSYSAQIRIESHKTSNFCKALLGPAWMFFRCYVLQRGFLDGKAGFLLALMSAQGTFYRSIKQIYPDNAANQLT